MKQFWTIFSFELKGYLKNKVFLGITIFLVVAMAAVMFFPRVIDLFGEKEEQEPEQTETMALLWDGKDTQGSKEIMSSIQQAFANVFPEYEVKISDESLDKLQEEITAGEVGCAFAFENLTSYHYYVDNLSMYDRNIATADEVLQQIYRQQALLERGIPEAEVEDIFQTQISHEVTSLGKDQGENFFYTYIMVFALYMMIMLYGQMVATNVATEKSSRAMELLVTSAKPASMMFGKVLASCCAGFLQLVVIFGSAILLYQLNSSAWTDNPVISTIFDMPVALLVYMLVFFVLGFFIYAFLYGAIGSMASKVEDINTTSMPITFLFIIGFMIVIFAMSGGSVDSPLMVICSYVPFTSSMAMFTRIAMSTVPMYEIILSIAILIASVIAIGFISARIYRKGVLMYGKPPKLMAMLKKE